MLLIDQDTQVVAGDPVQLFNSQLGAGVSLPGVVAARCGARVTLSDSGRLPLCLENCRRSCAANGLEGVPVMGLTWGEITPALVFLPALDVILGSDVFYEPEGEL